MRGATGTPPFIFVFSPISIHAPHAGRDSQFPRPAPCRCISIHAPHAGRDACPAYHSQSRSCYFNPRAPCGARPQGARRMNIRAKISIHAPHAGRDGAASPRVSVAWIFQSTRPMRGATKSTPPSCVHHLISIHAPHAGRDLRAGRDNLRQLISIHAPHAGRDGCSSSARTCWTNFNPRAPCGARRSRFSVAFPTETHFNPRAPCGARPAAPPYRASSSQRDFNPRAPCGARQLKPSSSPLAFSISIHAPHAGRDGHYSRDGAMDKIFQSTRPMRGATAMYVDIHAPRRKFQSTRPMRGATPLPPQPKTAKMRFQSTRPMRGAT